MNKEPLFFAREQTKVAFQEAVRNQEVLSSSTMGTKTKPEKTIFFYKYLDPLKSHINPEQLLVNDGATPNFSIKLVNVGTELLLN